MKINADFSRRAAVHAASMEWSLSPVAGVDRKMLDRVGDEIARATSIVRYAPGSSFPAHDHDRGEEFLVLEGTFEDEYGDYPVGSYVRNPPGSRHSPRSGSGCMIFVKLRQFAADDTTSAVVAACDVALAPVVGRPGVRAATLFANSTEIVQLERWESGARITLVPGCGLELLCLGGEFLENGENFALHSWLRLPPGTALDAKAGAEGACVWVKRGHLRGAA